MTAPTVLVVNVQISDGSVNFEGLFDEKEAL